MRKQFDVCNKLANNGLYNNGQLSEFLKAYLSLADKMQKTEIAYEAVAGIPPAESLNSKDKNIDVIVSMCEQSLVNNRQNVEEITHSMGRVA